MSWVIQFNPLCTSVQYHGSCYFGTFCYSCQIQSIIPDNTLRGCPFFILLFTVSLWKTLFLWCLNNSTGSQNGIQKCLRAGKQPQSLNLVLLGNMKEEGAIWLVVLWSNINSLWWNWNYTAVSAFEFKNVNAPRDRYKQKWPTKAPMKTSNAHNQSKHGIDSGDAPAKTTWDAFQFVQ